MIIKRSLITYLHLQISWLHGIDNYNIPLRGSSPPLEKREAFDRRITLLLGFLSVSILTSTVGNAYACTMIVVDRAVNTLTPVLQLGLFQRCQLRHKTKNNKKQIHLINLRKNTIYSVNIKYNQVYIYMAKLFIYNTYKTLTLTQIYFKLFVL